MYGLCIINIDLFVDQLATLHLCPHSSLLFHQYKSSPTTLYTTFTLKCMSCGHPTTFTNYHSEEQLNQAIDAAEKNWNAPSGFLADILHSITPTETPEKSVSDNLQITSVDATSTIVYTWATEAQNEITCDIHNIDNDIHTTNDSYVKEEAHCVQLQSKLIPTHQESLPEQSVVDNTVENANVEENDGLYAQEEATYVDSSEILNPSVEDVNKSKETNLTSPQSSYHNGVTVSNVKHLHQTNQIIQSNTLQNSKVISSTETESLENPHLNSNKKTVSELKFLYSGKNQCCYCGRYFSRSFNLSQHIKIHTGVKTHLCSKCGKVFTDLSTLKQHKMHVHGEGERKYTCDHCQKKFYSKSHCDEHKRTHTKETPYKCSECGREYAYPLSLKRHARTHTGVKNYKCTHCGKNFAWREAWKRHVKKHEGDSSGDGPVTEVTPNTGEPSGMIEVPVKNVTVSGNLSGSLYQVYLHPSLEKVRGNIDTGGGD